MSSSSGITDGEKRRKQETFVFQAKFAFFIGYVTSYMNFLTKLFHKNNNIFLIITSLFLLTTF